MTELEYNREIEYIFNRFPSYQKVGKVAYKPGVESMMELDTLLGSPHTKFKTIHVAGTNGKGTVSHMIAASLEGIKEGAKIGLYTSPHLLDFRERIKVNGKMISKEFVYNFITTYKSEFERVGCSFFEITTAMAFAYFANCGVDYAVIECGLGGRLDSTNIITPELSIITNIGLDHCEHLGYSYKEVATEKGGIIKAGVSVVIGSMGGKLGDKEYVGDVFREKAAEVGAELYCLDDEDNFNLSNFYPDGVIKIANLIYSLAERERFDLKGCAPQKNFRTVALALGVFLYEKSQKEVVNYNISDEFICSILDRVYNTANYTGLRGRWETLSLKPEVKCDTGHNSHGFKIIGAQLSKVINSGRALIIVLGVVADKDLDSIIPLLPKEAYYYFVNAEGSRALPAETLAKKMISAGFKGEAVVDCSTDCNVGNSVYRGEGLSIKEKKSVKRGVELALERAREEDFIFIGGSTFVVAEALTYDFAYSAE